VGLRLKYFAGEAVVNLKRNLFMTIAAISTVAVSLFLLGGVIVLGHIVNNVVGKWEGKVEVNVFLRDDISPTQQVDLQASIKGMPEVQDVYYDSKQQAYDEYKQMFAGSPTLIQNVDPNALPASFRVKLHDPNKVDSVRSQIIGRAGVDSVTFGGDAVKKLLRINALLRTISLVMTILLLTAATVAAGVIWLAKMLWLDRLSSFLAFLPIGITAATVAKMFLVLVLVGISVGALGSTLALRRFLEV